MADPRLLCALLQVAGCTQLMLAWLHVPIAQKLNWRADTAKLPLATAEVFYVHTYFICLTLVFMGLLSSCAPQLLLEKSALARWLAAFLTCFWGFRLYCQLFVYSSALWRGKRRETAIHIIFTLAWLVYTSTYAAVWRSIW
jgi:hypothetical protein